MALFPWFESSSFTYFSLLPHPFIFGVHSSSFPRLRDGLKHILSVSRIGNGYIQAVNPWELVKGSAEHVYVWLLAWVLHIYTSRFPPALSFSPLPSWHPCPYLCYFTTSHSLHPSCLPLHISQVSCRFYDSTLCQYCTSALPHALSIHAPSQQRNTTSVECRLWEVESKCLHVHVVLQSDLTTMFCLHAVTWLLLLTMETISIWLSHICSWI